MIRLAVTLTLCLALAGCLTNEAPPPAAQTGQPAAAAPPVPDSKPAAAPAQRRPPAAARASNPPPPAPEPQEAPTDPVLEIRQTCWSQGNANKSFKNIEARADWVNACIADKMKALR